jgi:hypothetical protein
MSSAPIPMNRKQRREQGVKATPDVMTFMLAVKRVEYQREDGATMAKLLGIPVTANGKPLMEDEAVDGEQAWIFESQPIMVKRPTGLVSPKQQILVQR